MIQVLLAVYQGEKYLRAQLDSLLAQTYTEFEILCQDDGSTDRSPAILAEYAAACPQRVRLVSSAHAARGPQANFMSLLGGAHADYYAFCDQDDLWHPDKLAEEMEIMQEAERLLGRQTPLLVHTDLSVIDREGKTLHESMHAFQGWRNDAVTLPPLLVQNNCTGCTILMNASLRRLMLLCPAADMYMHDWWAALAAAAFGRVLYCAKPTVSYRQHDKNEMGASRQSMGRRVVQAATTRRKAIKARVRLTYTHAQTFYDCYRAVLPEVSRKQLESFLKLPRTCKPLRMARVIRGGYLMQAPATRLAHILFC